MEIFGFGFDIGTVTTKSHTSFWNESQRVVDKYYSVLQVSRRSNIIAEIPIKPLVVGVGLVGAAIFALLR